MLQTKIVKICTCDICGKENAKTYHTIVYRTFDAEDGHTIYNPPRIEETKVDLCNDCALKATNLHSVGICAEEFELKSQASESTITYHIVFCPRYRRKIFDIPGLTERFKELTSKECEKNNIKIIAVECNHDYVHMVVNIQTQMRTSELVKIIKNATSHKLREEFVQLEKMNTLWTKSYFISSAGNVSTATIKQYVQAQKTRN